MDDPMITVSCRREPHRRPFPIAKFYRGTDGRWSELWTENVGEGPLINDSVINDLLEVGQSWERVRDQHLERRDGEWRNRHRGGVWRTSKGYALECPVHAGRLAYKIARLRPVLDDLWAEGRDTLTTGDLQMRYSRSVIA